MSSTRTAKQGSPLRQERYASDPAFNESLKASAVARKCSLLSNPAHREIALYLQAASMQPGGLTALASDFLKRYGDRIGSKSMRENLGMKEYDADLVHLIRDELGASSAFLLHGEYELSLSDFYPQPEEIHNVYSLEYGLAARSKQAREAERDREAARRPTSYSAETFLEYCTERAAGELEEWLIDYCLDPRTTFADSPAWFHALEQSILDYMADRREDHRGGKTVTSIGGQINDALEYAWEEKCLVHISGVARMGKTHQIKQWCSEHPGRVRYVQVPSDNADISFFRAIARALGTAAGSAMKTTQVKRNIEDAIQDSGIMLVLDEANYLFPQYKDPRSSPRRINWLLTEVVNKGIPTAIVSTPHFDKTQEAIVKGSGWASEQLDGRIAYRLDLPALLPAEDLIAIARHYLPDATKELLQFLSAYARRSGKYLAGLEAVSKRARFLARKAGRNVPNASDVEAAMVQVDPAIAEILNPKEEPKQSSQQQPATPRKRPCKPSAQSMQKPGKKVAVTA